MSTNNARQAIARGMARGRFDPLTDLIREEEAAERRKDIRASFRVLYKTTPKENAKSYGPIENVPMQLSTAGEVPTMERTDDMYRCKPYRPDNSRHRDNFRERSSLKTLFQEQAYETWTSPFYGMDRVE